MSKEYIEREVLLQKLQKIADRSGMGAAIASIIIQLVQSLPAADVEPVIHAKWEMVEEEKFWICNMEESLKTGKPTKIKLPVCSHCKTKFGTLVLGYKRCPECGAIMDGGNK